MIVQRTGYPDGSKRRIVDAQTVQRHIRTAGRTQGFHRDDARTDDAVRLFYDAERVEVQSSGLLTPGLRLDDLHARRAPSRSRNPIVTSLLCDIPGGDREHLRSSVTFIIQEMQAWGGPAPAWGEQGELVWTEKDARSHSRERASRVRSRWVRPRGSRARARPRPRRSRGAASRLRRQRLCIARCPRGSEPRPATPACADRRCASSRAGAGPRLRR